MVIETKTLNKLQVVQEIFEILARTKGHISVKDMTKKINNKYLNDELETSEINVKRYIKDIQKYMGYILDVKNGRDGGYSLHESDWKFLSNISNQRLSAEEKNALNDAFEIARKSSTYYYVEDLDSAEGKLHLKMKIKDQDYEYYVGKTHINKKHTELIKKIKKATMNHFYVNLKIKYDYYKIPKTISRARPIYLIHDTDESFVILKHQGKTHYLNVLNIMEWENIENKKFSLINNENIDNYKNDYSIKAKQRCKIKFKIITERGLSIFNLWNHQFEDLSNDLHKKEILFYEEYRVYQFLFRIQSHIEELEILTNKEKITKGWNKRIKELKKI